MTSGSPQRFADDFAVGEIFTGEPRQVDDRAFGLFAEMTGDAHPIHYDDAYAASTRFGRRLTHGLLLMATTALGATQMSEQLSDAMVAFVDQGCRFLKPVFVGDEVTPSFTVASVERKPGRDTALVRLDVRLSGADGEPVLEGHHTYLLRCRPGPGATA